MFNKMKSKTISRFSNSSENTSENGGSVEEIVESGTDAEHTGLSMVPSSDHSRTGGLTPPTGTTFATEAGHSPRYRFHDADGEHLHTLDGKPLHGTSTIASATSSKDGLLWWSAERAAVACLESGEYIPTIRKEYKEVCALGGKDRKNARDRLQRKYPIFKKARYAHREAKEAAAQPGTDMHAELEKYIKACIYNAAGDPTFETELKSIEVERFQEWAIENVAEFLWSEAHCYSEELWTGGICDVGMVLKNATPFGHIAIGDFKSGKDAYFSQFVQIGGYARQIRENGLFTSLGAPIMTLGADYPIGALIIFYFGCDGEPRIETNVPAYMHVFEGSVWHYKLKQEFEQ